VCFEMAISIRKEINHVHISSSLNWLGVCFYALSDYESALPHYQEASKKRLQSTEDEKTDSTLALYYQNAGACLYKLRKHADAKVCFEMAISIQKEINHVDISRSLNWLGECFYALSEYESALSYYQEAIQKRLQSTEDEKTDSRLALYYHNAGACLFKLGKYADAKVCFQMAISIRKEICRVFFSNSIKYVRDCFCVVS